MFDRRYEGEKAAAARGTLGGQAIPYAGDIAEDCAPRVQHAFQGNNSPVKSARGEGRITQAVRALEQQIEYSAKAVAVLEQRLDVFRRPIPTGAEGIAGNEVRAGSVLANGLAGLVDRLAIVNARLHELAQSIDL